MRNALPFTLAGLGALLLAACGADTAGDNAQAVYEEQADALDNAADESAAAAQPILENAADDLRDRGADVGDAIDAQADEDAGGDLEEEAAE